MWFIVKILWTWNLFFTLLEISKPFFFSIFGNAIITIAKKKKILFPYFGNDIAAIAFFFFFFKSTLHSGTLGHTAFGRKTGQWNFVNPIAEIQYFLSPYSLSYFFLFLILSPALYSLSCFLAEFRQCHCRNSVSLLIFPIIFEQFV